MLLLVHNEVVSVTLGWVLFALWIGKELALFPLVRRAYEPMAPHGTAALVGERGVVTAMPADGGEIGYVRIGPELWRAMPVEGEALPAIGTPVRIEAVEGYTLRVALDASSTEGGGAAPDGASGVDA